MKKLPKINSKQLFTNMKINATIKQKHQFDKEGDYVSVYLCIDLKTFYASVECVERNLDPFNTKFLNYYLNLI